MKSRVTQFAGRSAVYIFGNLFQKSAQLLLIPLYTRIFSPAEYGFYGAALAVVGVVGPLIDLGISSSMVRFIHEHYDNPARLSGYLKLSFILRIVSVILVSLVCGLLLFWIYPMVLGGADVPASSVFWLILLSVGGVLVDFVCSYFQAMQDAVMFVVGKIGQTILQIVAVLLVLFFFKPNVVNVLAAQAVGSILVGVFILLRFYRKDIAGRQAVIEMSDLKHNLTYGVPLVPHRIGTWLRSASDRVILSKFLPMAMVGYYQLASSIGNALGVFVSCLDLAFAPIYYRMRKKLDETKCTKIYWSYCTSYLVLMGILCFAIILFSGEIISILAPRQYSIAEKIAPLIVCSIYFQGLYTLSVKPLFYEKRTTVIPVFTLGAGVVGTVANILFTPKFGVMTAAWTTLLMYLATFLGIWFSARRSGNSGFPIIQSAVYGTLLVIVALGITHLGLKTWDILSVGSRLAGVLILLTIALFGIVRRTYRDFTNGIRELS